ncbi:MAG: aldose epimerase [Planctomycetaceae bacterium]|nr:aldose epimerase [Planctomycetaceae bacterium]
MEVVTITDPNSGSKAQVAAHRGFNCFQFHAVLGDRVVDVIDSVEDFASGGGRVSGDGIPLLFPFPNRIREGKFQWEGRDYHIPDGLASYDNTGNAIHGLCLDRSWRVIDQSEQHVVGQFQLSVDAPDRSELWPGDFIIEVEYFVRGASLRSRIKVKNPGDKPIPWGLGTHTYFRLPLCDTTSPDQCLVQVPVNKQRILIDCLPTGEVGPLTDEIDLRDGLYFDGLKMDDAFAGVEAEDGEVICSVIDEKAGLTVVQRCPDEFKEVVVFTPPGRNAVCMEPYTCCTDAINMQAAGHDAGLRTLGPGEEHSTWVDIDVGAVVV